MRLSQYFLPILKEDPINAEIVSHRLMLRAGMIRQQNSGIYTWLPLGLKVLQKIERIIKQELNNKANAIELLMPCVQPASLWKESGRYDSYGKEMLCIKDRHNNDLLFAPTAEEAITSLFKSNIKSYKELPKIFYQTQWKFRDEIRPRFGVMRGREFYMKDAYSFDVDENSARKSYDSIFASYISIFKKIGLCAIPVKADTGPIGGDLSHEFHVIANTGESDIFYDARIEEEIEKDNPDISVIKKLYTAADDMHNKAEVCNKIEKLKHHKSIEVGHIFYYANKYSKEMDATIMDDSGRPIYPHGGCYGIGISRLVAAIIESFHDEKGILWPKSVAPFQVSIVNLHTNNEKCTTMADKMYKMLKDSAIDVLYDDLKDKSPGNKLATNELIGVPKMIVIGSRLSNHNKIELKDRKTGDAQEIDFESSLEIILNALSL